jgi:uncharacterized protein YecE (DUF72 family)
MVRGRIVIGLSGYSYKPWRGPGRFYPEDLNGRLPSLLRRAL